MPRRKLLIGAAGAVAVLAAGCGGSAVTPETAAVPTVPTTATTAVPTVATVSTLPTVPVTVAPTPTVVTVPPAPTAPTAPTVPVTPTTAIPTTATPTVEAPPPVPTRPRHLRAGVRVVAPRTYARDVLLSLSALRSFSTTLQGIDSAGEFRSSLTSLRRDLRTFDGIIRRLRSYQLMSPSLDKQRARLALQGPPLARSMSNFLDAVRDGNATRARTLASEVMSRLARFRKAA